MQQKSAIGTNPSVQDFDFAQHQHSVQFYSNDVFLLDALSRFMGSAIGAGDAGIVIATEAHRLELAERLSARGLDLAKAVEQGRYVALDAAETLAQFMVDGWPDEKKFVDVIGGVIHRAYAAAVKENGRAALFGEMVALLWAEGKTDAALRLEQLWNQIAQSHSFSLVCAYPLAQFYSSDQSEAFLQICQQHTAVVPAESYTQAAPDERLRRVAEWQQRAQSAETQLQDFQHARQAALRLAAIVQSSDDAIVSKDLNGMITSWNPAAERIFGWKAEEIIGKSVLTIIPPELHQDEDMILAKIRRGERIEHFETVRLRKDGTRVNVSLTISPIRNGGGKVVGASKIARDISDRKRAEEVLQRAEKLAATGQVAASIAHEINNPMQALTNLMALIAYKSKTNPEIHNLVGLAEAELSRMAHISRQMLSFYRDTSTPVELNLRDAIEDALEPMALKLRGLRIQVDRRYEYEQPVRAFPVEMRQVFSNLLSNAAEAVGHDGTISIRVRAGREWRNGRHGVRVSIADSGAGIPTKLRRRLFEPFFTTKSDKGTGLGLWVVGGIVARHQGSIRFRSCTRPGRSGTIFSIFLPTEEAELARAA